VSEGGVSEGGGPRVPVTYQRCAHVGGPFFHGTRSALEAGDELVPGHGSNFQAGRTSNHVYFSALVETAVWGAELATALAGGSERGRVYVVEPLGPFEDDPNVTDKRFPGNPTQSYRTRHPLRVVREVDDWEGHEPAVLQGMLDSLARLREQGLDVIED
jgi:hypothetical protein